MISCRTFAELVHNISSSTNVFSSSIINVFLNWNISREKLIYVLSDTKFHSPQNNRRKCLQHILNYSTISKSLVQIIEKKDASNFWSKINCKARKSSIWIMVLTSTSVCQSDRVTGSRSGSMCPKTMSNSWKCIPKCQ